jgi:ATP-binding cassette subfamily B protein
MSDLTLNNSLRSSASPSLRQYRELLSRYLKPQIAWVIFMAVVLLAGIALKLINPQVLRYFLDTAQAGGAPRNLTTAAGLFLTFAILQEGMSLATRYTAAMVGWSSTNRLRADLALHILRLDMPFHKSRTPGELIDRADGDVSQLSNFLSMFSVHVIGNGLLVVGILALLFRENAWLGLGMLVYTLLTLLVLRSIQRLAVPRWAAERQSSAMLYGYIEERISGAEEIRAAGAESYVMRKLYEYMRDLQPHQPGVCTRVCRRSGRRRIPVCARRGKPGHGISDHVLRGHALGSAAKHPRAGGGFTAGFGQHSTHQRTVQLKASGR